MRKITIEVTNFFLHGKNELVAMNRSRPYGVAYKRYRDTVYRLMCHQRNPGTPFAKARVHLHIRTLRAVDVDSKHHMGSVVLDVLQPERGTQDKRILGLGWIANDTDGENGLKGCIVEYRVTQEPGHRNGGFTVTVEEVEPQGGKHEQRQFDSRHPE